MQGLTTILIAKIVVKYDCFKTTLVIPSPLASTLNMAGHIPNAMFHTLMNSFLSVEPVFYFKPTIYTYIFMLVRRYMGTHVHACKHAHTHRISCHKSMGCILGNVALCDSATVETEQGTLPRYRLRSSATP